MWRLSKWNTKPQHEFEYDTDLNIFLLEKTCAGNFNLHISSKLISNVCTKSISDLGKHGGNRTVILFFQ